MWYVNATKGDGHTAGGANFDHKMMQRMKNRNKSRSFTRDHNNKNNEQKLIVRFTESRLLIKSPTESRIPSEIKKVISREYVVPDLSIYSVFVWLST